MRCRWLLLAVLLAGSLASAPMPARAASVLSNGIVAPTSGTTADSFTFSVDYASSDPIQPAQAVWADVGSVTVTLHKVSGTAHDGTWQGTSTLPAGSWPVTFHATTSIDAQPAPIDGPIVTVTQAPIPTPLPTPRPTARPTPTPSPPSPGPISPPVFDQPTPPPDNAASDEPSPSSSGTDAASTQPPTKDPASTPPADEDGVPVETPEPSDAAADDAVTPPGSMLGTFLIVGGTMSIAGAAVLAHQWVVSRRARPH